MFLSLTFLVSLAVAAPFKPMIPWDLQEDLKENSKEFLPVPKDVPSFTPFVPKNKQDDLLNTVRRWPWTTTDLQDSSENVTK